MIITESNISTIAKEFLNSLDQVMGELPYFINVWNSHQVEAIRLINSTGTHYIISIEGEEICKINPINFMVGGEQYENRIAILTAKLLVGMHKFMNHAIEREVGSILGAIQDLHFTSAVFIGGLVTTTHQEKVDHDAVINFIDIRKDDQLIYSAPLRSFYNPDLRDCLTTYFKRNYWSSGLVATIP